jgi:hypothetical protein
VFLQHDVCIDECLLECHPLVAELVQHFADFISDGHLVLLQNGELIIEGLELGFGGRLIGVEFLPKIKTIAQLIQVLGRATHSEKHTTK